LKSSEFFFVASCGPKETFWDVCLEIKIVLHCALGHPTQDSLGSLVGVPALSTLTVMMYQPKTLLTLISFSIGIAEHPQQQSSHNLQPKKPWSKRELAQIFYCEICRVTCHGPQVG